MLRRRRRALSSNPAERTSRRRQRFTVTLAAVRARLTQAITARERLGIPTTMWFGAMVSPEFTIYQNGSSQAADTSSGMRPV